MSPKIEALILEFTSQLEELVRSQLRAAIATALDTVFASKASRPRHRRERVRPQVEPAPTPGDQALSPAPASPPDVAPATPPESDGKRRGWTRESVVAELGTWLLTGTVVEAAFVTKHGKPGLVAAARKHFGRFDAALNAANVHLARRYPEGPPTANRRQGSA